MTKFKQKKLIIICDESVKKGKKYSYFYGGAMVEESYYQQLSTYLNIAKAHFGLHEMKRIKISNANYQDYISVLGLFFEFVKSGKIKVRVMFSPNSQLMELPKALDETYFKFYYTFIKNAFSLFYSYSDITLRLIFDELPDKKEVNSDFKDRLIHNLDGINSPTGKVRLEPSSVQEVDSKAHPILQCIDVITGVIENELNRGDESTSKRNIAKRKVFNFILSQISEIHENFVLTETTRPIFSVRGFKDLYKHFVYKKKVPDVST